MSPFSFPAINSRFMTTTHMLMDSMFLTDCLLLISSSYLSVPTNTSSHPHSKLSFANHLKIRIISTNVPNQTTLSNIIAYRYPPITHTRSSLSMLYYVLVLCKCYLFWAGRWALIGSGVASGLNASCGVVHASLSGRRRVPCLPAP